MGFQILDVKEFYYLKARFYGLEMSHGFYFSYNNTTSFADHWENIDELNVKYPRAPHHSAPILNVIFPWKAQKYNN